MQHLKTTDAMNNATFYSCHQIHGDFGRFIDTTFVARDLEAIRKTLNEDQITGYFVSYGSAVGITYANMFPDRIGRLLLDGVESVKDQRRLGGFAWSSVYSILDTWREGFLGECLDAGPSLCPLARPVRGSQTPVTLEELETRMDRLFQTLIGQPISGYTHVGGPGIITYSQVAFWIYTAMYSPSRWPLTAKILDGLEVGDARLALDEFEKRWYKSTYTGHQASSLELPYAVVCADSYDDPLPEDGLVWWDKFWADLTKKSWISGTFRFTTVFGCRHYNTYWPSPPGVYRGELNHTLSNPVLAISGTHDPATPLKNGRDTLEDMGVDNARLIVHHGYGHMSTSDPSNCTDGLGRAYILQGEIPESKETHCYANHKPYRSRSDA
jgi:pimeloyl-ACP methyl ester carboxylesterase